VAKKRITSAEAKTSGLAPDDVFARMRRSFEDSGEAGRIRPAADAIRTEDTVPTGIPPLDRFLHGGVWMGRVTEVSGPPESGKTSLCYAVMASMCRAMDEGHAGLALYVDAERAFNAEYAQKMGVDLKRVFICEPQYGQQAFQRIYEFSRDVLLMRQGLDPSTRVRKGTEKTGYTYEYEPLPGGPWKGRAVAFMDSLAALMSLAEYERVEEGDFSGKGMAEQARMASVGFREIIAIIADARVALVITNQQRENISAGPMAFGPKKTTPAGSASLYYASVRLETGKRDQIKDGASDDAQVIGQYLSVRCRKSKVYSKFEGAAEIKLPYTVNGLDYGMLMFDSLMTLGILKKNESWYSFVCEGHPLHGQKFQGTKPFHEWLADGRLTLSGLEELALGTWKEKKAPEGA
jgi:recombination protein RecA